MASLMQALFGTADAQEREAERLEAEASRRDKSMADGIRKEAAQCRAKAARHRA